MSKNKFSRIVSAALAETKTKFGLAEALATDIPPRHPGIQAGDIEDVRDLVIGARQAIIDAGGEPRSVETLIDYRKTAMWAAAIGGELTLYSWLPKVSYSAHNEARRNGMSYADFAALDKPTVDEVRRMSGKAGTDGQPTQIASTWTPTQQAEVVKTALRNPEVVRVVAKDVPSVAALAKASDERMGRIIEESDEKNQSIRETGRRSEIAVKMAVLTKTSADIVRLLGSTPITDDLRQSLEYDLVHTDNCWSWIKSALSDGSTTIDAGLAALLGGE